jgi:DHA2 family multidrug resistance protein-like MFS transporter
VLAPVAANRFRPAWTLSASLAVTAIGFGLLTQVGPQSGLPFVVAGSVIGAVGLAPVYVLTTELTVAAVPPARSGTASGLLTTTANLGGALGIAFLGSLGGAIYRHGAHGALSDPPTTDSARDAFTLAFRVVEAGGAGMIAACAVVSALLLRRRLAPA